jgi:hypothetical protein
VLFPDQGFVTETTVALLTPDVTGTKKEQEIMDQIERAIGYRFSPAASQHTKNPRLEIVGQKAIDLSRDLAAQIFEDGKKAEFASSGTTVALALRGINAVNRYTLFFLRVVFCRVCGVAQAPSLLDAFVAAGER